MKTVYGYTKRSMNRWLNLFAKQRSYNTTYKALSGLSLSISKYLTHHSSRYNSIT